MSNIRPFERGDLAEVAALYQRVMAGPGSDPTQRLVAALERGLLDHPWVDPELPSLVYQDAAGRIVGFQGSHPRRLSLGGGQLRMVCGGQLVADPDAGTPGIGALLMRRLIAGPQELTITDGATSEVQAMWARLGGSTGGITCLGWTRVLRPARLARALAARRRGANPGGDRSGRLAVGPSADELTPEALIEQLERVRAPLRPAYDPEFLGWLFAEMEQVQGRGPLARRLVRDERAEPVGWYVAYLPSGGIAQAIGVGTIRPDAGPVLDRLFADARAVGASAVQGRTEPATLAALTARRCLFRRTEWALVHYADDEVAAACGREQALLTRLEGEWWMDYHLLARAAR